MAHASASSARVHREGGQQRAQRRLAAVEHQIDVVVGQQTRRVCPIARRLRVLDCLDYVPVLLEPGRGGPVDRIDERRMKPSQLDAQQVRE